MKDYWMINLYYLNEYDWYIAQDDTNMYCSHIGYAKHLLRNAVFDCPNAGKKIKPDNDIVKLVGSYNSMDEFREKILTEFAEEMI